MMNATKELLERAKSLPPVERTALIDALLASADRSPIELLHIDRLSTEERLTLIEQIWDSIEEEGDSFPLTEAQIEELERRLADYEANPDDALSWEQVKASIDKRLS